MVIEKASQAAASCNCCCNWCGHRGQQGHL